MLGRAEPCPASSKKGAIVKRGLGVARPPSPVIRVGPPRILSFGRQEYRDAEEHHNRTLACRPEADAGDLVQDAGSYPVIGRAEFSAAACYRSSLAGVGDRDEARKTIEIQYFRLALKGPAPSWDPHQAALLVALRLPPACPALARRASMRSTTLGASVFLAALIGLPAHELGHRRLIAIIELRRVEWEEAFAVIRDAMAASKMVGISRVVLYRRERAVMLEPRDRGIILWTLRYGDEVRDEKAYFAGIDQEKPEAELLSLAQKFIKAETQDWSPTLVKDPVQEHPAETHRVEEAPEGHASVRKPRRWQARERRQSVPCPQEEPSGGQVAEDVKLLDRKAPPDEAGGCDVNSALTDDIEAGRSASDPLHRAPMERRMPRYRRFSSAPSRGLPLERNAAPRSRRLQAPHRPEQGRPDHSTTKTACLLSPIMPTTG